MRPTLRQLEYLVAIADTGRIGLAAQQLHVSQPSLSAQLSDIETDLGVTLFRRGRAGAVMTMAGEDVVRRARQILHAVEDLREAAKGSGLFSGHLRLGVLPSIGPYLLPLVVPRLREEHPGFRLIVREESTRDLDEGLRNGRFDMIISTPEDHPGSLQTSLFREDLWVALARDHALAQESGPLSLDMLKDEIFLTLGDQHRLSHIVAGMARAAGGRVSSEYEGTSLDAVRLMAATGAGIAILPSIHALSGGRWHAETVLRPLHDPAAMRDIAMMQPLYSAGRQEAEILAAMLRAEAARIMAAPPGQSMP